LIEVLNFLRRAAVKILTICQISDVGIELLLELSDDAVRGSKDHLFSEFRVKSAEVSRWSGRQNSQGIPCSSDKDWVVDCILIDE
jgi:hypothetical protein